MKRKITALLLAAAAAMLAGCSGQKDNGGTGLESESSQTSQQTTTSQPAQEELPESTAPAQTESVPAQTEQSEQAATQESSEETVSADADYVALITAYDNTFLGLPSAERVYIFKDMSATEDIDGRTFHQVDAYNEEDGALYYMCTFFISEDGGTVYRRKAGVGNVLLPESAGFPALDPQIMTADEVFADAYYLCSVCLGRSDVESFTDVTQTIEVEGVPGEWARVTDTRIETKEKLLNALSRWFTDDVINVLMDAYRFTDRDGALYYYLDGTDARSSTYTSSVWELTELSGDRAVYTEYALFTYEAGETKEREYTYTVENFDGVWTFTEFHMPWTEQ